MLGILGARIEDGSDVCVTRDILDNKTHLPGKCTARDLNTRPCYYALPLALFSRFETGSFRVECTNKANSI